MAKLSSFHHFLIELNNHKINIRWFLTKASLCYLKNYIFKHIYSEWGSRLKYLAIKLKLDFSAPTIQQGGGGKWALHPYVFFVSRCLTSKLVWNSILSEIQTCLTSEFFRVWFSDSLYFRCPEIVLEFGFQTHSKMCLKSELFENRTVIKCANLSVCKLDCKKSGFQTNLVFGF